MAERWYTRLSQLFKHELNGRQKLILYAAHPHFQQTNILDGEIGEGTGGVTESAKRRVILPFAGGLALPLWFIEGMAEYLSIGPVDSNTASRRAAPTRARGVVGCGSLG